MDFNPQIQKGDFLTNEEISKLFRCAIQGGMRRSLKTNSLVLVTDKTENTYKNISRDDNEIWWFSGMGNEFADAKKYEELYEQFELIIGKDKNDLFESQQIMLKKITIGYLSNILVLASFNIYQI